jgi:transcriptional regulator with XRE-family HTH domain
LVRIYSVALSGYASVLVTFHETGADQAMKQISPKAQRTARAGRARPPNRPPARVVADSKLENASAIEDDIGRRIAFQINRERRLKSLRLKDVADAAGLSQSLVSKIEHNKVKPSLSTLHRIAKVLGTSISALLAAEDNVDKVVFRRGERPVVGKVQNMAEWEGIEAEIMVPHREKQLLEGFVFLMEPGGHSGGVLQHDGEECGYVLDGQLELTVGERSFVLGPGDSFFFPSDIPHTYRNPGRKLARVIWINTPPTF